MSYLAIARSGLSACEKSEKRLPRQTSGQSESSSDCEISEICEKSPVTNEIPALLTLDEAEALKAQIIAVVKSEPAAFDRVRYDALTARWVAHERALTRCDDPSAWGGADGDFRDSQAVEGHTGTRRQSHSDEHAG